VPSRAIVEYLLLDSRFTATLNRDER